MSQVGPHYSSVQIRCRSMSLLPLEMLPDCIYVLVSILSRYDHKITYLIYVKWSYQNKCGLCFKDIFIFFMVQIEFHKN